MKREIRDETPILTAKERDLLQTERANCVNVINTHLDRLEDSPFKTELVILRDRIFLKFPNQPSNLTIWQVAYFEDWLRELAKVPPSYFHK